MKNSLIFTNFKLYSQIPILSSTHPKWNIVAGRLSKFLLCLWLNEATDG